VSEEPSASAQGGPEPSPRTRFVRALGVPRNARTGAVAGVAFALGVYLLFVVFPPATSDSRWLLLVLAFVVAVSVAILVVVGLTVRNAARMTADVPRWIARGGTTAMVGGAAWTLAGLPALASAGGLELPGTLVDVAGYVYPVPPLALACGAWAIHARNRHTGGYPELSGTVVRPVPGLEPGDVSGLLGTTPFALAVMGLGVVAWIAVLEPAAFLGGPVDLSAGVYLGANLLAALGTSLLGAAALWADGRPRAGPVALLCSLPASLVGVALLATLDAGALAPVAFGVALGTPWVPMGRTLREREGVPPVEEFRPPVLRDQSGDHHSREESLRRDTADRGDADGHGDPDAREEGAPAGGEGSN